MSKYQFKGIYGGKVIKPLSNDLRGIVWKKRDVNCPVIMVPCNLVEPVIRWTNCIVKPAVHCFLVHLRGESVPSLQGLHLPYRASRCSILFPKYFFRPQSSWGQSCSLVGGLYIAITDGDTHDALPSSGISDATAFAAGVWRPPLSCWSLIIHHVYSCLLS